MDAFRCVELPEPYIYVIDPITGATKAVIDRFFSFMWVERRTEAGELEITAPEDTYWGSVIQEGDYVHFKGSSVSKHFGEKNRSDNVGRYTMIVESKYTTFDADNGYTTYVKGHSIDILLERRINLGITPDYLERVAKEGYLSGFGGGGYNSEQTINVLKPQEDRGEAYYGLYFYDKDGEHTDPKIPFVIENLAPNSTYAHYPMWQVNGAQLIYLVVDANCGPLCKNPNRRFPNFEVYYDNTIMDKAVNLSEEFDGKFDDVYSVVTDLLPNIYTQPESYGKLDEKTAVGMRLVGWTEGVHGTEYKTVFKMGFELYRGEDYTVDGPHKSDRAIIYSRDMDNLISMNYLTGEANYKNVIYYDTGWDYTPDDLWAKQKEKEAKEKEKDLLDSGNDERQKQLELEIDTLDKEIEKLEEKYEDLGLRMPYISVLDRNQILKYHGSTYGEVDVNAYPKGLDRRELYVDDELPFQASSYGNDYVVGVSPQHQDDEEAKWQGRPYLAYRYTKREDPKNSDGNSKPEFHDRWIRVEWFFNARDSIASYSKRKFSDPGNSKENDVEAELNYNAVYQPKRNYDLGDIVTVMGEHHNEIIRDARIDEMAYSIDSSGYTIVPTFTILPIEDDAT